MVSLDKFFQCSRIAVLLGTKKIFVGDHDLSHIR